MRPKDFLNKQDVVKNYEGAEAYRMSPEMELYSAVVTSTLENSFYEAQKDRVQRIAELVSKVDPVFVAKLAVYVRREMNLRSIPLLLLVELAKNHNGDDTLRKAVSGTVLRADEIAELLMCYQWLNPAQGAKKLGKLSRGIQNGLKDAFNRFDEYQFAKYDRHDQAVKLRDALFLVHPKAKDEAQQEIFDKIAGEALETPYTWETELSALGQQTFLSERAKKDAFRAKWEELIDSGKLGYMALLRNLRNILEADVDREHISDVCKVLSSPARVRKSRQFPFRFLSAYREIADMESMHVSDIMTALEQAMLVSADNIAGFGPETSVLIASDVSGSMECPVSRNSSVEYYDIGLVLSMLLHHRCATVVSGIFGDRWKICNLPRTGILANTMKLRDMEGEVGYSTNGYLVIEDLIGRKQKMDKVMMFTDCQLWDSRYGDRHISASWKKYRSMYPDARLYLFDLSGYGHAPLRLERDGVALIAGWNDKVFDVLQALESGSDAIKEINKIEL